MKKIDLILMVYGKRAFDKNLTIKYQGEEFSSWYIEDFEKKEQLISKFTEDEIVLIYESGV